MHRLNDRHRSPAEKTGGRALETSMAATATADRRNGIEAPRRWRLQALVCCGLFLAGATQPSFGGDEANIAAAFEQELAAVKGLGSNDFLAALPARAYVEGIPFDVTEADFYPEVADRLALTARERAVLAEHGMVIVDHAQDLSFGSAYYGVYTRDLPVLITTDSILHALHKSYDNILMQLEGEFFAPTIEAILKDVQNALADRLAGRAKPTAPDAYLDLYLTVARNLLTERTRTTWATNPSTGKLEVQIRAGLLVPSVSGLDDEASAIIERQQSLRMTSVELFGGPRRVDFSQFKPRGHYTKSPVLQDYFRAMMWLGRADTGFYLNEDDQLRAAVLLARLLRDTGGDQRLRELDAVIEFMVGRSDNLGPDRLLSALQVAGIDRAGLGGADLETLRGELATGAGGRQQILSQHVVSPPAGPPVPAPALFQLFGQRFVIDSFVLSQVVFDRVVFAGVPKRYMPSGLDVVAALGNDEAARWLAPELDRYRYAGHLEAARRLAAGLPDETWTESLYNLWLDTLRTLQTDLTRNPDVPAVFRSLAWQRKQTQTQLASWSQLRHDTILYAKQSFTGGLACFYPYGYVEPYPAFYRRVGDFARRADALFQKTSFSSTDPRQQTRQKSLKGHLARFFQRMDELVGQLETLAEKELAGEPFSEEETAFLRRAIDMHSFSSGGPTWSGWYLELFYGRGGTDYDPTVSDVHTDPNSGMVLETAVGQVNFLVVAIENPENPPPTTDSSLQRLEDGEASLYVGPVFSYYEFEQPMSSRMTDEEWTKQIKSEQLPPRPDWIEPILGDREKRTGETAPTRTLQPTPARSR